MKKSIQLFLLFFSVMFFTNIVTAQTNDLKAYNNALDKSTSAEKIAALKKFKADFPKSKYLYRSDFYLFREYLNEAKEDSALYFASLYVYSRPENSRRNAYNSVAYSLAEKQIGLDTARVYAERAVSAARKSKSRSLASYLDTQAFVYHKLGNNKKALTIQSEAIKDRPNDPEILYYFSVYQEANGLRQEALLNVAKAIYLGQSGEAIDNFNKWINKEFKKSKIRKVERKKIVDKVLSLLGNKKKQDKISISNTAAYLGKMSVDLIRANKLALSAVKKINSNTPVSDLIALRYNYAIVLNAMGKRNQAIKQLNKVKSLTPTWMFDYWLMMGKIYESKKDVTKALDAYASGLFAYTDERLVKAVKSLIEKYHLNKDALDKLIDKKKKDASSFHPEKFKGKNNGKVVLAELFTGAECPPCVAADKAFDMLSEYFNRNTLAILEYHVHIPGPDPMTNPSTLKKYEYYGNNFGTPTVFFNGTEKLTGGGSALLAKNRFQVYSHIIKKYLKGKSKFIISGSAKLLNNKVNIKLKISKSSKAKINENIVVNIALVEKSIKYSGGNGMNKHIFVVRKLLTGKDNNLYKLKNRIGKSSYNISLKNLEKDLSDYLSAPDKYGHWRLGPNYKGWRERTDKLNYKNLSVVVWLQNQKTKEVYQSHFIDVI